MHVCMFWRLPDVHSMVSHDSSRGHGVINSVGSTIKSALSDLMNIAYKVHRHVQRNANQLPI